MAESLENQVWEALRAVRFPGMSRDVVSFGFVDKVSAEGGVVRVELAIVSHNAEAAQQVRQGPSRPSRACPASAPWR
jgi:ATP-binding protein involved in chromosome partitioning